jgi:cytochrome c oxidase subunit II
MLRALLVVPVALVFAGCDGQQSSLAPAGREAAQLSALFWWMTAGALFIWVAVLALAAFALRARPTRGEGRAGWLIIGGGAIVPTVVLAGLLAYGLSILPGLVAPAPEGSLKINVAGERWWWRVHYPAPDGGTIELANEIRLPVGEPVQFTLESSNVIHAFWIPSLGGKRDMIPGRVTQLALTPTRTGIYRGVCAEYCGTAHALMAFPVVVMEKPEFAEWLAAQSRPAAAPATRLAARGQAQFFGNGCAACHTIRGTSARGVLGPDLTHFGSRLSIAAGTLANEPENAHAWLARVHRIKPGALMPNFGMLDDEDLRSLAAYLEGLK